MTKPTATLFTQSDALLSECGTYRYWLTRTWDDSLPVLVWIMLNPSTADASRDDPTIRRCIGFARAWNFGGIRVVNLFAFRATKPVDLVVARDPVGPDNNRHIREACRGSRVIAAWGNHGDHGRRDKAVVSMLAADGVELECLGQINRNGSPRHPLFVRADVVVMKFKG